MAGNVAEWTSTAYDETVYEFSHELSPRNTSYHAKVTDPPAFHRKVTWWIVEGHRILLPDRYAFI